MGEELRFDLPENPTTGYRWQLQVTGDTLHERTPPSYAPATTAIGAGGTRTFRFIATQPGTATIRATLARVWEPDHPLQDHLFTVHIGATQHVDDQ